ncbi:MAG: hypothetical protein KIT00_06860 [Rhodospirillales bacterium]|nr:hypothetical protein [Rhodospirillales bacterium]
MDGKPEEGGKVEGPTDAQNAETAGADDASRGESAQYAADYSNEPERSAVEAPEETPKEIDAAPSKGTSGGTRIPESSLERPEQGASGAARTQPPPAKKRGCLGTLFWLVVLLLIVGVGGYYTFPQWQSALPEGLRDQATDLHAQIQSNVQGVMGSTEPAPAPETTAAESETAKAATTGETAEETPAAKSETAEKAEETAEEAPAETAEKAAEEAPAAETETAATEETPAPTAEEAPAEETPATATDEKPAVPAEETPAATETAAAETPATEETPAEGSNLAVLTDRIGALEQAVAAQASGESATEGSATVQGLAELKAEAAELSQQLASVLGRVNTLEKDITALRNAGLAAVTAGAAGAAAAQQAAELSPETLQRLERLEQAVAQSAGAGEQLAAVQSMETKLQGVEEQLQGVADIDRRVAELESVTRATEEQTAGATAAALALNGLGQALGGSGPFADELATLKQAVGDDAAAGEAVAALEPHAAAGVPTLADLYSRFPAVTEAVVQADTEMQEEGWEARVLNRLQSLVSIRRTGEAAVESGGVDSVLSLAEQRLAKGDLQAAVSALEGLEGAPAEAAGDWVADAKARLTADDVLKQLQIRIISLLSKTGG